MDKNEEVKKDFVKADVKFDSLEKTYQRPIVELKPKTFMKISDVDREDAEWFKKFADDNADRKQFLAFKIIRNVMERMDPLVGNVLAQINSLNARVDALEGVVNAPESEKPVIPAVQKGFDNKGGSQ